MSAIANITVYDGAATPVAHTLTPVSVTRNGNKVSALWRELITTIPVEAQVSLELSLEQLKSGVMVETTIVQVPVMESVSGNNAAGYTSAPKVAFVDKRITQQFSAPRSTIAGRRLLRQLDINLQGSIATSVAPVTTGPLPELFDLLVNAT